MYERIKFRAKRKDTNEWVYGNYHRYESLVESEQCKHYISELGPICDTCDINFHEIIPETLGQYINIKDFYSKKEIYEGDLVKINGYDEVHKIIYCDLEHNFKMYALGENGYMHTSRYKDLFEEIEVIGNIYEKKDYYIFDYYEGIKDVINKEVKIRIEGEKELIEGVFTKFNNKYKLFIQKECEEVDLGIIDEDTFDEKEDTLSIEYVVAEKQALKKTN